MQKNLKDISDFNLASKSKSEKKGKGKARDKIKERMKGDVQEKTKCRLIQKDKWERTQYTKKCESNTTKDVDTTCLLYKTEGETKEHIVVCQEENLLDIIV